MAVGLFLVHAFVDKNGILYTLDCLHQMNPGLIMGLLFKSFAHECISTTKTKDDRELTTESLILLEGLCILGMALSCLFPWFHS